MVRFEVVVRMSWADRDAGRTVAIWLRRSLVAAADGRERQTVGGRARPEKVLSRMLTLFGDSMSANICFGGSIFLG